MRRDDRLRCRIGLAFALLAFAVPAVGQQQELQTLMSRDAPGASDHPLTGRYQGSVLLAQTTKAFDGIVLPSGPAEGKSFERGKQKFTAILTFQGRITRSIYIAPPGRSAREVLSNFEEAIAAKGFQSVFRCEREACGEAFPLLKYRRDKPETKVLGENYEHRRTLLIDAAFDQLVDLRYGLFRKTAPEGDTYVAVYGGLHRGGAVGSYSRALTDRVGALVEVAEPRDMERRMAVVSADEIGGKVASELGRMIRSSGTSTGTRPPLRMLVASVVGVRQALDYRSTWRAVAVVAIGWIAQ
jgi:OmpA-OmpF porin, OOP family